MKDEILYAEIDSVSEQMKADKDIVIISDGALFLACRKVVSHRYNLEFYPVDAEAERAYMLFRRGTTNLISYSPYASDNTE